MLRIVQPTAWPALITAISATMLLSERARLLCADRVEPQRSAVRVRPAPARTPAL